MRSFLARRTAVCIPDFNGVAGGIADVGCQRHWPFGVIRSVKAKDIVSRGCVVEVWRCHIRSSRYTRYQALEDESASP